MTEAEKILNHYLDFRKEIDKICVPEILKYLKTIPICYNNKQVGIFCYVIQPTHTYIDCIYVEPEYRKKGLATKTVLDFDNAIYDEIRLHIINENKVAYDFWNSIFDLEEIESNAVDTLYKVVGRKLGD